MHYYIREQLDALNKTMKEHIKNDLAILIIAWIACFLPAIIDILLWIVLAPDTFWQKLAMVVITIFAVPLQGIGIIIGCFIQSEYNTQLKAKRRSMKRE